MATVTLLPHGARNWFGAEFGLAAPTISRPPTSSCSTSEVPSALLDAAERFGLKRAPAPTASVPTSISAEKRSALPVSALAAFGFPAPSVAAPQPQKVAPVPPSAAPITPFGNSYTSSLYQLLILQSWIPTLDRLSPAHKAVVWQTCELNPSFKVNTKLSFRKVITAWAANVSFHLTHITTLFGAIGYLKHHGVLKNDFCFPDTAAPVFRTFIASSPMSSPTSSPVSSPPASPPSPSLSAAMSAPGSPMSDSMSAPLSPSNKHRLRDDSNEVVEKHEQPLKRSRVMEVSSLLA